MTNEMTDESVSVLSERERENGVKNTERNCEKGGKTDGNFTIINSTKLCVLCV